MNSQTQLRSVLPASKTIKKKDANSPESKSKKYKTFDSNIRKAIISSLMKGLSTRGLVSPENSLSPNDFVQLLENIELSDFNKMLQETLKKHVMAFRSNVQSLRQWRRKIKQWILSSEKPETRGHVLIPHNKLDIFKELLIPELQKMPNRNCIIVQKKVLKIFDAIDQPVPGRSCSKHWWYCFLERNPDIKEIWDQLPKRVNRKNKNKNSKEVSDSESEPELESPIKMEEETRMKHEEQENMIEFGVKEESDCLKKENFGVKKEEEPWWNDVKRESDFTTASDLPPNPLAFYEKTKSEVMVFSKEAEIMPKMEDLFMLNLRQSQSMQSFYLDHFGTKKEEIVEFFKNVLSCEPKKEE